MSLPAARMLDDGTIVITPEIDLVCERLEQVLHVSPEIIARVRRLNPDLRPNTGEMIRGLHRKEGRWWGAMMASIQKGEFIQRFGREAFAALPADCLRKRGRRVWVDMHGQRLARQGALK